MLSQHLASRGIAECACMCSTLEQRAKRLFLTKDVPLAALDTALFAKSKSSVQEVAVQREVATLEAMIYRYTELLGVSNAVTLGSRIVAFVNRLFVRSPLPQGNKQFGTKSCSAQISVFPAFII